MDKYTSGKQEYFFKSQESLATVLDLDGEDEDEDDADRGRTLPIINNNCNRMASPPADQQLLLPGSLTPTRSGGGSGPSPFSPTRKIRENTRKFLELAKRHHHQNHSSATVAGAGNASVVSSTHSSPAVIRRAMISRPVRYTP